MLDNVSIATKAQLTGVALSIVCWSAQMASLAWASHAYLPPGSFATGGAFSFAAGLALAWTYLLGIVFTGWWTRRVTRLRARRLTRALDRIAAGELRGPLEPSIDTDLVIVRESLARMQGALDAMTSRLKHVDAQRRRLFGDLTHELAHPIGTILAISDALKLERVMGHPTERERLLAFLAQESTRLERLVGDMRDLAWLDDPAFGLDRAPADVAELAKAIVARFTALRGGSPRIELDAERAVAEVDAARIEQVITNLVANACRYAKHRVVVQVRLQDDTSTGTNTDAIAIAVEDDGEGVPDERLPHLGERLYRPDESRSSRTGGHGLGLSIVRAVVDRHGGSVGFSRAPLGGLRAEVTLPLALESRDSRSDLPTP
ncbi:MAG: sensor histidine kinase [Sandaracinaceae bacterium]